MKPFILDGAIAIPSDENPSQSYIYDMDLQLWVDKENMTPLIDSYTAGEATLYGETILTDTVEGADQSEIASTIPTSRDCLADTFLNNHTAPEKKTLSRPTQFGETLITKTAEGVDTSEVSPEPCMDLDAPHSHF